MERVNQELNQYLQIFVNKWQDDWYNLLLLAEFQYNNHVYTATQQTLFLLNTGQTPYMGFELRQHLSGLETVNEFMKQIKAAVKEAKSAI